jgi:peroxiredoxin
VLERKRWEIPEELKGASEEVLERWWKDWLKSDEGKAYRLAYRGYDFVIEPDGTFRIEDVVAGTYRLLVRLRDDPDDRRGGLGDMLARAEHQFTIEEMPGGCSDEPLDLGEMELTIIPRVGQPAPGFELDTIDGTRMNLNDFRGKYLLLHFGTADESAMDDVPALKSVYESYGKDDRFAVISLSIGESKDAVAQYAAKHGLTWPQAYIADWSLPKRYGLVTIPWSFLIGPDGKIIAKNLQGEAIREALSHALGAQPGGQPVTATPSIQSTQGERHKRAAAEIDRLGGRVTVETGEDGEEYTSVLLGGSRDGRQVEWQGGVEGLKLLYDLANLRSLRTINYEMGDAELAQLKDLLPELEKLILQPSQVTDEGLKYLKGLKRLKWLRLDGSLVTDAGLEKLEGLTQLTFLTLQQTDITDAGLARLKGLVNLEWLYLSDTQVGDEGLQYVREMPEMNFLILNGTKVGDAGLVHLKGLTKLEGLYLGSTQITDAGLAHLKGMTHLTQVGLGNAAVTDAGLVHLGGLTNLVSVDLGGTRITAAGFEHLKGLTKLETLYLNRVPVTDAAVDPLSEVTSLRQLVFENARISQEGETKLREALPNCEVIVQQTSPRELRIGNIAPDLVGTDLTGNEIKLSDYKGKVVVLHFWSTRSSPSVVEASDLVRTYSTYHPKGLEIIGISLDTDPEKLERFLKQHPDMRWPQICDGDGWLSAPVQLYRVEGIPYTVVLDGTGTVRHAGLHNTELRRAIAALLPERT